MDNLNGLSAYVALNPLFNEVIEFLKEHDLAALPVGKHKIKGDDVFVNIQEAAGKTKEQAVVEYHRKMVDIQIPFSSEETYGYIPTADLPAADFNEEKDVALLPGVASQSFVTCKPGMFVIFFPQDGHAPFITDAPMLRKAIFKIKA